MSEFWDWIDGADPRLPSESGAIDRPDKAHTARRATELARIEAAGGHLHTWPGGLDVVANCKTCGALIDQFGQEVEGK